MDNLRNCPVCRETVGPEHQHPCAACGAVPGEGGLTVGGDGDERFVVCDLGCLHRINPEHELMSHLPPEYWEAHGERVDLEKERDRIKRMCEEKGIPWN